MKYRINEIFNSVQGEGFLAGIPSTFIRLQICTVGCPWCDTKYTWAGGGELYEVGDLYKMFSPPFLRPHVVITGGEPTVWNLDELIRVLREQGGKTWGSNFHIQLETSGQNSMKGTLWPDWVTWSPKKNLGFKAPKDIMMSAAEVKWVVDDDLMPQVIEERMAEVNSMSPLSPYCILMPEGTPPTPEHIEKTLKWLEIYPRWRYGNRLQWYLGVR